MHHRVQEKSTFSANALLLSLQFNVAVPRGAGGGMLHGVNPIQLLYCVIYHRCHVAEPEQACCSMARLTMVKTNWTLL